MTDFEKIMIAFISHLILLQTSLIVLKLIGILNFAWVTIVFPTLFNGIAIVLAILFPAKGE